MTGFTITGGVAYDPNNGDGPGSTGGGIRDVGNVNLTLNNIIVTGNIASADGGGIGMEDTVSTLWTLTINNSIISNNHAGDAGGGIDADGAGKIFINAGTIISRNTSVNQGAGIWLDAIQDNGVFLTANLTVTGALIEYNDALTTGAVGGGIGNAGNGTVTINSSTLFDNFAGGNGGGFGDQNNAGALDVSKSLFLDNVAAGDGGAIEAGGPNTTITSSELKLNVSGMDGGGLFANGTTLSFQNSTVAYNVSAGDFTGPGGGGIELETTGTGLNASTITASTIVGNTTLNSGSATGGGIDAPSSFTGNVVLLNDTINNNHSSSSGGGIFWADAHGSNFSLQNTIVAGNFSPTGPDLINPVANFIDRGGNLIGLASPNNGNTGLGLAFGGLASTQVGTTTPLNALLMALGNYGGPVIGDSLLPLVLETEAPAPGSPALGKGVVTGAPSTDERGMPFVVNGKINIGAF
jgi:hypothetical protein